jgi:hypothetical protein
MTTMTLISRPVAQETREFSRQKGSPVGERGRLSREAFVAYFLAKPKRAREVAKALNIPVSSRGRLSEADAAKVATVIR